MSVKSLLYTLINVFWGILLCAAVIIIFDILILSRIDSYFSKGELINGESLSNESSLSEEVAKIKVDPKTEDLRAIMKGTSESYEWPEANTRYYSRYDVPDDYSKDDITYIINEICAREGIDFEDSKCTKLFIGKTWYEPKISEDDFMKELRNNLNSFEYFNLKLLFDHLEEMDGE